MRGEGHGGDWQENDPNNGLWDPGCLEVGLEAEVVATARMHRLMGPWGMEGTGRCASDGDYRPRSRSGGERTGVR